MSQFRISQSLSSAMHIYLSSKKQRERGRKKYLERRAAKIEKAKKMQSMYRERIFAKLEEFHNPAARTKKQEIKITAYADALLRKHEPSPVEPTKRQQDYSDHQFPLTYISHLWEPAGERRFEDFQKSYYGVQKRQESGNLTHDLTTLIRARI